MIRSMTGFGRAEGTVLEKKVTVEFRALNSKGLDLTLKLPSSYRDQEAGLRQQMVERVGRGKVDLAVFTEPLHPEKHTSFDAELVRAYYTELKTLTTGIDADAATDLMGFVLRMPDVTRNVREEVSGAEWAGVMAIVEQALRAFDGFRSNEGGRLQEDLASRTRNIIELLSEVETLDAGRSERVRDRLRSKVEELGVQLDKDRFEQELVYFLEKYDINEEKVRLRAHCAYFLETMEKEDQQGRKLGFIGQEMGREINTLGSKANDAVIQRLVVRMKDELEKIKEQSLNVL